MPLPLPQPVYVLLPLTLPRRLPPDHYHSLPLPLPLPLLDVKTSYKLIMATGYIGNPYLSLLSFIRGSFI